MRHLEEKTLQESTIYKGNLLHVKKDAVELPNGRHSVREYIVHPGAVVIVALNENDEVILERQYRYPARRVFIELPAGKTDPGEDPESTGRRELQEETGYQADEWVRLGETWPAIGYSNECIHIYLARALHLTNHSRDEDEFLEVFSLALEDTLKMVESGEIVDAKTQVALFLAKQFLGKQ